MTVMLPFHFLAAPETPFFHPYDISIDEICLLSMTSELELEFFVTAVTGQPRLVQSDCFISSSSWLQATFRESSFFRNSVRQELTACNPTFPQRIAVTVSHTATLTFRCHYHHPTILTCLPTAACCDTIHPREWNDNGAA